MDGQVHAVFAGSQYLLTLRTLPTALLSFARNLSVAVSTFSLGGVHWGATATVPLGQEFKVSLRKLTCLRLEKGRQNGLLERF